MSKSKTSVPVPVRVTRAMRRGATRCALAGGVSLLAPASLAAAQEADFAGSAFVGYAFGSPKGLHWGVELRTRVFGEFPSANSVCGSEPPGTFSAGVVTARLGTIGRHFYAQLLGGFSQQVDWFSAGAQLGVGYQLGATQPIRVPVLLDARAHVALLYFELDALTGTNGAAGLGVTLPSVARYGRTECVVGRPLRDDRGGQISMLNAAETVLSGDGPQADEVAFWSRCAVMESESVPAFAVLAIDLLRAGAPAALIEGAIAAGDDEVMHARLAASCAGGAPTVEPLDAREVIRGRSHLSDEALLTRLAVESWLDGCLGEALAAQRAALESERLACTTTRSVQRIIAADEHRHAELAWGVLEWATEVGGVRVKKAVRAALDVPSEITEHVDPGRAASLGYLDRDAVHEVQEDVRAQALRRVRALIA